MDNTDKTQIENPVPPAGRNREYILGGVVMRQHLIGEETGGAFSLFENNANGNSGTPIHVHAFDDETLYVLEGQMRAIIDGKEHSLNPGQAIFLPREIPHQLMNASAVPARYLLLCTPSGFEGFLAEAGRLRSGGEVPVPPTAKDIERLRTAAPAFGITLLKHW